MSRPALPGVHHVTALSGAAQQTLDFYAGVLGLRLVKRTVNFDDPMTHHLYYGDMVGRPGTLLTFFPWPQARPGRPGAGMVQTVAFAVPRGTLDAWADRLDAADVDTERTERFGDAGLRLRAPDGLPLELVESDATDETAWAEGPAPDEAALQGFYAPTLPVFADDRTPALFEEVFGWERVAEADDRVRFRAPGADLAGTVDLRVRERHPSGRMGRGTVHHIAFRAPDEEAQQAWQTALRDRDIDVTDVKDRQYFRSIYFRDPDWTSGILFEIASDGPGFLTDEDESTLGEALKLPPWLENRRDEIEGALPSLTPPAPTQ